MMSLDGAGSCTLCRAKALGNFLVLVGPTLEGIRVQTQAEMIGLQPGKPGRGPEMERVLRTLDVSGELRSISPVQTQSLDQSSILASEDLRPPRIGIYRLFRVHEHLNPVDEITADLSELHEAGDIDVSIE
jgi:hypothetical protein